MVLNKIEKENYRLCFDSNKKQLVELFPNNDNYNWIGQSDESLFGIPFIGGTSEGERNISVNTEVINDNYISLKDEEDLINIEYFFYESWITIKANLPKYCGPRAGLHLDFNILDSSDKDDNFHQMVAKTIYTDENYDYGYFIFQRPDGKLMFMTINKPFAAWRFKYSYCGHRVLGMQLLSEASDVIDRHGDRGRLKVVDELEITFGFVESIDEAYSRICDTLNISITKFDISGGQIGSVIPTNVLGDDDTYYISPSGKQGKLSNSIYLEEEGIYLLKSVNSDGRVHISRILCHKEWKEYYNIINKFYMQHFQLESGAFARIIWKDSLSPEGGFQYENIAFGNDRFRGSCRTGEFGGFAGWALLKNLLLYGNNKEILAAASKYINNWALNKHQEELYTSALCREPHDGWSAYHLYKECNFPQYEVWLMEQLIDYYTITNDREAYNDLLGLADHFITDHIREDGCVLNVTHDYCTVHTPSMVYIKLGKLMEYECDVERSKKYFNTSRIINEYILSREFDFPTEGEPCTEDGSIGCAAVSLLAYYYMYEKNNKYLEFGKKLIDFHDALIMDGFDCRMKGSSIRYWETHYESRDYGSSYNAGHAWSLWSAEARFYLALINGDIKLLKKSYNAFISNMCKVEENGGMTLAYSPDMIPGIPHDANFGYKKGAIRETSGILGMQYPKLTYSTSGNYFLVKYAETFKAVAGVDFNTGDVINGYIREGVLKTNTVDLETLLIEGVPNRKIRINTSSSLNIIYNENIDKLKIKGANVIRNSSNNYILERIEDYITIGK